MVCSLQVRTAWEASVESGQVIYIVGAGGIGMPLAALLTSSGVQAVAVRTSRDDIAETTGRIAVDLAEGNPKLVDVRMVSLARLPQVNSGVVAVATKATANRVIAPIIRERFGDLPVVVLQNGLGVERPFVEAGFPRVLRCVLYATGQHTGDTAYRFREVAPSPVGAITGDGAEVEQIVARLSTPEFRFRAEDRIVTEVWRKVILNAAFNSICPLINIDNGVFERDPAVAAIARTVIEEAIAVASRVGVELSPDELMEQLLLISRRSSGQLISTLQDLLAGRETEIDFLNRAIARTAAELRPPIDPQITRILGELVLARSRHERSMTPGEP